MERLVVSAAEAARMLNTSQAKVLEAINAGEIDAYRDGNTWRVVVSLLVKRTEARAIAETKERREKWQG